MWPDLPESPSKRLIEWASRDEQSVNRLKKDLPREAVYKGSAGMTSWALEDLYNLALSLGDKIPGNSQLFYRNLYEIQVRQ